MDDDARGKRLKALRDAKNRKESYQPPVVKEPVEEQVLIQKPAVENNTDSIDINDQEEEEKLMQLGPKKADWDLKRDVEAKLDTLERRTHRAIVSILREQLEQEEEDESSEDE